MNEVGTTFFSWVKMVSTLHDRRECVRRTNGYDLNRRTLYEVRRIRHVIGGSIWVCSGHCMAYPRYTLIDSLKGPAARRLQDLNSL